MNNHRHELTLERLDWMNRMLNLLLCRSFALGFLLLPMSVSGCANEPLHYDDPLELCKLENKKINESSGLAVSRRNPDHFWTHNDSGDQPRIFCFDRTGKHIGTCKLKKARAVDWEDMCSFEIDGKPKLLIGDIGDNAARRKVCRLYELDEPEDARDEVSDFRVIRFRYSTGPTDCEAIAVDVVNRKLILAEKKWGLTCRVFEARYPYPGDNDVVARPIARVKLPLVTAMDISGDGRRAILLTLGQAFEFTRSEAETWTEAFAKQPRMINMPARRQGETICYGASGADIFLTSESTPTPFFVVAAVKNRR